jgi:hypothetical protein
MRLKLVEPMRDMACIASPVKRIEVAVGIMAGSLAGHENVLDLGERRILAKPFALCCILVTKCALNIFVCKGETFLETC